jgi:hypothetical protein
MDPLTVLFWLLVVVACLVVCGVLGVLIFFGFVGAMLLKIGNVFLKEIKEDKEKKL